MSHILEFLDLVDVPNTYGGAGGNYLVVSGSALIYETPAEVETALGGPFLPLVGGTMSGNIELGVEAITSSSQAIFTKSGTLVEVGNSSLQVTLLGTDTRPDYNGGDLALLADLNGYLPLTAGSGEPLTGNLYLDKTSQPSVYLRENAGASSYVVLYDLGTAGVLKKVEGSGTSSLAFGFQNSGTDDFSIDFFNHSSGTSGSVDFNIYDGAISPSLAHVLQGDTGNVILCQQGGNLYVDEGDLYLERSTNPGLFFREAGSTTDYAHIYHPGNNAGFPALLFRSYGAAGADTAFYFDQYPADGTSSAHMYLNRYTNTTGSSGLVIYKGTATSTIAHSFLGSGNALLCGHGGNATIGEGNLYIDKTASPSIFLREAASGTDYCKLVNESTTLSSLYAVGAANSTLRLDPVCGSTDAATVQMFRTTNTSGGKYFYIHKGDGTAEAQHFFNTTGAVELCRYAGSLTVGEGSLYLDKTSDPAIYLREAGSGINYTRLRDTSSQVFQIAKFVSTAAAYIDIEPIPSGGTSGASIRLFRLTNTTADSTLNIYPGDGTTTANHTIIGGGDANFCKTTGSLQEDDNDVLTEGAAEFSVLTSKTSGVSADLVVIEDSAASYAKKKLRLDGLVQGMEVQNVLILDDSDTAAASDAYRKLMTIANRYGKLIIDVLFAGRYNSGAGWWGRIVIDSDETGTPTHNISYEKWLGATVAKANTSLAYGELTVRELSGGDFEVWCKAKDTHGQIYVKAYYAYHYTANSKPLVGWSNAAQAAAPTDGTEIFNSTTSTPNFLHEPKNAVIELGGNALSAALAPKTTAITRNTNTTTVSSGVWATCIDLSSGPYVLYLLQNTDTTSVKFRITVDGTLVWTSPSYLVTDAIDTGPGSAINVAPVFSRSSLKVEVYATSSTVISRTIVYHTLSFS